MKCPNCSGSMRQEVYESVTIDICSTCLGVWLDHGELSTIISIREQRFDADEINKAIQSCLPQEISLEENSRDLACPKCAELMAPVPYQYSSGIMINKCPHKHGMWLDQGELDKIQIYVEKWEDEVLANADAYNSLLKNLKQRQETMLDEVSILSAFSFINALIRKIINVGL